MGPLFLALLLGVALLFIKLKTRKTQLTKQELDLYRVPEELAARFKEPEMAAFQRAFAMHDADRSGAIDKAELGEILAKFEMDDSAEHVERLLQEVDTDGRCP